MVAQIPRPNAQTPLVEESGVMTRNWYRVIFQMWDALQAVLISGVTIKSGAGSPEGVVTANPGSHYMRTDGGAGTSFYVKESGTGNTGWVAK